MTPRIVRLLAEIILVGATALGAWYWPGVPGEQAAPAPVARTTAGVTRPAVAGELVATPAAPAKDLEIGDRELNRLKLVTIDGRHVSNLPVGLFAPGARRINPLAAVLLDLNDEESARITAAMRAAQVGLFEKLQERATYAKREDGLRIEWHLEPGEVARLEAELRESIGAVSDELTRHWLEKLGPGWVAAGLFPVPLGDMSATITRQPDGMYRIETAGRDAAGQNTLAWKVGSPAMVLGEFYGQDAAARFPPILSDARKRSGPSADSRSGGDTNITNSPE
jgi:hypothetical protein